MQHLHFLFFLHALWSNEQWILKSGEGASSKCKQRKPNNANILANHFVPSGESVEVDVVAQQVCKTSAL